MSHDSSSIGIRVRGLRRAYSRLFRLSLALSLTAHAALVFASIRVLGWSPAPHHQRIGYSGPTRIVDLAPLPEVRREQESLARARSGSGALVHENLQMEEVPLTRPAHEEPEALWPRRDRRRIPEEEILPPGPVITLREDWSSAASSEPSFSDQFRTLKIVKPDYPREALLGGIQGLVRLEVQVGISGKVTHVRVLESFPGNPDLERASMEAMVLWEFEPFRRGDQPIPFTLIVPFRYRLLD